MTNPTPRRFRYSLGFLIFWILLSSFFLHKSFLHYERTSHIVNNVMSSIVFVEENIDQGWPWPVYHYTLTSHDDGFFSTETPYYVVSQNPKLKHEVNTSALSGNIGVCLALGLIISASIVYGGSFAWRCYLRLNGIKS